MSEESGATNPNVSTTVIVIVKSEVTSVSNQDASSIAKTVAESLSSVGAVLSEASVDVDTQTTPSSAGRVEASTLRDPAGITKTPNTETDEQHMTMAVPEETSQSEGEPMAPDDPNSPLQPGDQPQPNPRGGMTGTVTGPGGQNAKAIISVRQSDDTVIFTHPETIEGPYNVPFAWPPNNVYAGPYKIHARNPDDISQEAEAEFNCPSSGECNVTFNLQYS